jgi:hypothetical protein
MSIEECVACFVGLFAGFLKGFGAANLVRSLATLAWLGCFVRGSLDELVAVGSLLDMSRAEI